ncbi:MAG: hypothetical protein IJ009_03675 [Clostridia bacterium]|nr:hypothetical protein [Clostridia bacterium]
MGLGYLALGYLLSLNFFVYHYLSMLPALLLMFVGMTKLSVYNRPLREARWVLYPTVLGAVLAFLLEGGRLFGALTEATYLSVNTYLSPVFLVLLAVFTDRLLCGLAALAKETELPKVEFAAKRDRLFSAVAYGAYLFCSLPLSFDWYTSAVAHAFAPVLLLRLIVTAMNAYLIYSCYMQICLPEDVDMPRSKTGIAFLDEMNEKMDRREEERTAQKKEELARIYREREAKYREKQAKSQTTKKKGKKK